jgi:hypothetical protein
LQVTVQTPLRQASFAAHEWPHAPQFAGSLPRSSQVEVAPDARTLHTVWPDGHAVSQAPAAVQTSVPVQIGPHTPLEQACPDVQSVPHAPQLRGSELRSVHSWSHAEYGGVHAIPPSLSGVATPDPLVKGPAQLPTQAPATHSCPLAQAVPQAPQLRGSDCGLVQNPVAPVATTPQTACPVGQAETHARAEQTSVPGHTGTQAPAEHVCPGAHPMPHPPQLLESVLVCVHSDPHCEYPMPQDEQSIPPSPSETPVVQPLTIGEL